MTSRSSRQTELLLGAWLLLQLGCGGRATQDGQADTASASEPLTCHGELTVAWDGQTRRETAPLHCAAGITRHAQGLGQLEATSARVDWLHVTFPTLESGKAQTVDCADAAVSIDGNVYQQLPPQANVVLSLERDGDEVDVSLEAHPCRIIGTRWEGDAGWPIFECVTLSVPKLRARLEPEAAPCGCSSMRYEHGGCSIGICSALGCGSAFCPASAAICVAL